MNAFQNMKLSGKLGMCFAAILVVIIAVGAVSSLQNGIIRGASEETRKVAEDSVLLQNVTEKVTLLQWAISEMLVTGSATYKQAYLDGGKVYEDALAKAKEAVADDATLSKTLGDVEAAIAATSSRPPKARRASRIRSSWSATKSPRPAPPPNQ